MARFFEMPQASPTMESGVLLAWHKEEGAELVPQDVIAEVETDKAAMDIEVFDRCFLLKILAPAGTDVPAGQPIAILGDAAGEDVSALMEAYQELLKAAPAAPAASESAEVAPASAPVAPAPAPAPAAPAEPGLSPFRWMGAPVHDSIMETAAGYTPAQPKRRASPLAKKVAADLGVSLQGVTGSGPHGRILRADVEQAASSHRSSASRAADQQIPNSRMRSTIARRLKESYLDAPVFFLTAELDCDAFVATRAQLKAALPEAKISYNDLLLRCVARALREVPECNASWGEDAITRYGQVDLGVAVAVPDGLITPVIRDAASLSLVELAGEARGLIGRALDGKLKPEEYTGATFTVSNLGMMGIDQFTAIINPPAAAILAVGALQQQPVVRDGELGVGWRMKVTMTCDHRVIDGALGARYLQALRRYVETPALLI